jgi:hypothetical protein
VTPATDSKTDAAGTPRRRGLALMALLAVLPVLAYAPALRDGRLLGPGDGAFLHYPLRAAVWQSVARGELPSWNSAVFSGTGLLAAYRPGALYLPSLLLAALPPFVAFQCLILLSLSASAVLTYLLLRQLGCASVGAYFGGLAFALGPYLVGHLADSATVIATPALLLTLIATEGFLLHRSTLGAASLAVSFGLLLTAGSPDAMRAGVGLALGRLLLAHLVQRPTERGSVWLRLWPLAAGGGLAALQLLPSLIALTRAGRSSMVVEASEPGLAGAAGLIVRYVSHTPAVALAAAALPLMFRNATARVLGIVLGSCLVLQWGRGPLTAPGALALVFDLALALLAALTLSDQWEARRQARGARGRGHFFIAALVCVSVLPISAAAAGPLAARLAPGVGLLTLALVLYFRLASHPRVAVAGSWLIPLTLSFVLQPQGHDVWARAPLREDLDGSSATRSALRERMATASDERVLTLTQRWPAEALDLAFGNLGLTDGVRSANGYDPLVAADTLDAGGLTSAGVAARASFFRTDPHRLEALAIRWVQVPVSALAAAAPEPAGGDELDVPIKGGESRFFAFPLSSTTAVRVVSSLSHAVPVLQGTTVARLTVSLASGRHIVALLRAGEHTAEWAYERADVRPAVRHARPAIAESWAAGGFEGHRYLATIQLPGRYLVNAVSFETVPGAAELLIRRLALVDDVSRAAASASVVSAFVSDPRFFRPALATPTVRLYELPHAQGRARVVARLVALPSNAAVLQALDAPTASGLDLRDVALALERDVAGLGPLPSGRSSAASVADVGNGRMRVAADGPGVLVVAEGWDPGWSACVDGQWRSVLRVNQAQLGVILAAGRHEILFEHRPAGFLAGLGLTLGTLVALGGLVLRARRRARREAS